MSIKYWVANCSPNFNLKDKSEVFDTISVKAVGDVGETVIWGL